MELHISLNGTRDLAKQITEQLREAISRHIGFSRGVRCSSDDLLVTNGAQQALDLVARVLVEPACTVVVEDPGYPPARLLWQMT